MLYGADAVYVGGKKFSLRARASNFRWRTLRKDAVRACADAKVYVTVNIVPTVKIWKGSRVSQRIGSRGRGRIILTSLYYSKMAKLHAPGLELHLSTQFPQQIHGAQFLQENGICAGGAAGKSVSKLS